jgi:hypothetical protein
MYFALICGTYLEPDGIRGEALRCQWPGGRLAGGVDRRPEVVAAAERDLAALRLFRAASPAAESVEQPLEVYERLVREVLEQPELRLL